jgi:hypothetical protein
MMFGLIAVLNVAWCGLQAYPVKMASWHRRE